MFNVFSTTDVFSFADIPVKLLLFNLLAKTSSSTFENRSVSTCPVANLALEINKARSSI